MRRAVKRLLFWLLRKDPEPVVVAFLTGDREAAQRMWDEIRDLIPDRPHFAVRPEDNQDLSGWQACQAVWRQYRRRHIGMAAVLFTADNQYRGLRLAAFLLAPTRVLAYNARGERHHLRFRTLLASYLFLRGVALDRIFLRPRWLCPWRRDRTVVYEGSTDVEGRPPAAGRRRVAIVTPYLPWPLSHGGAVRMFHLLREASEEFDIYLCAFAEQEHMPDCGPLTEFCARITLVRKPRYREPRWSTLAPPEVGEYRSPAMRRAIERLRAEPGIDLVQVEYTQLAEYPGDVLVEHDVTFDLFRQVRARQPSPATWWNWWRWRRFERTAVRRFRAVAVMSDKDARLLALPSARVIANGVDLERFRPEPEPPGANLLFIGSFRHFPNVSAFRFFIEEVWPALLNRFPEMTLTVVAGPDPLPHWQAFAGQNALPRRHRLTLHAYVADVRPLYVRANIVVVPTLVSAGTNIKVLEAMAMERALVSTSSGCAGLGLEHGKTVWVADGAAPFTDGIARLASDPDLRARIAREARLHAERHFSWSSLGDRQRALWRQLLGVDVAVRPATPADLPAITRIQQSSPGAAQWDPPAYLDHDCRVAVTPAGVAGFIVMRATAQGEWEILNLAVDPSHRRRGVAETLVREALAGASGAMFLEVRESNWPARRLYEKAGFVAIGLRDNYYSGPAEAAIVMRLQS